MTRAIRRRAMELGLEPRPLTPPPSRLRALALAPWFELTTLFVSILIGGLT